MNIYYSDVDDTIASNSKLSDNLIDYIKDMEDLFVPCSGRPLISMKKMFENLNVKYLIGFNGAQIYDVEEKRLIFNELIDLKEVEKISAKLKELNLDFLIYSEDEVYSTNVNNKYAKVEEEICNISIKELKELISTPKILGLCDPSKVDDSIKILKENFENLEITKSKPFFIEITLKGITKGKSLLSLNKLLNIDLENTYCFGDSDNDISMFDLNINRIAVSNANDNIKKRADYICKSCFEDGVYKYLKGRKNV